MAKGGCFYTIRAIRSIIGCVCCILLAGPILMIVGIVTLHAPNNRDENVSKFNQAVSDYSSVVPVLQATTISCSQSAFPLINMPIVVVGNTEGVVANRSSTLFQSSNYLSPSNSYSVTIATGTKYTSYSISPIPNVIQYSQSITCNQDTCYLSDLQQMCNAQQCSGTYSGSSQCYRNQYCGVCYWSMYLASACFQMTYSTSGYTLSGSTCDYPFSVQRYACLQSSGILYQFRDSRDPYITLSQLTKGSMDFGLTRAQQQAIGVALLVSGLFITVGIVSGAFLAIRLCVKPEQKVIIYQAFGRHYPQAPQPYVQPLAYTQPPPVQPTYQQPYGYPQAQPPPHQAGYYPAAHDSPYAALGKPL